jgi:hypothetical protein
MPSMATTIVHKICINCSHAVKTAMHFAAATATSAL